MYLYLKKIYHFLLGLNMDFNHFSYIHMQSICHQTPLKIFHIIKYQDFISIMHLMIFPFYHQD